MSWSQAVESLASCSQVFGLYLDGSKKATEVLHLERTYCIQSAEMFGDDQASKVPEIHICTLAKNVISLKSASITILPIISEAWCIPFI